MNRTWLDLRYGLRVLRARKAHAIAAILTLALGIGGTTAVFSLVNTVLAGPLPVDDPDRIAMIWEDAAASGFPKNAASPLDYTAWETESRAVEALAASAVRAFALTGGHEPEKVQARAITPSFFTVIGVRPARGRAFQAGDATPGADRVVILSDGLWRRRYGADPGAVGRSILLDGEKYTIVGVMPRGFQFFESYVRLWVPLSLTADERTSDAHYLDVIARLPEARSFNRAQADLDTITRRVAVGRLEASLVPRTYVVPLREELVGDSRRSYYLLLAAVAGVLLIGCANLAGLLLARAASREREFAVRVALGAGRGRVVAQLLTESALLAVLGSVPALWVASASLTYLQRFVPESVSASTTLRLDLSALAFLAITTVAAVALFGLAPALHVTRTASERGLHQRGAAGADRRARRARSTLVIAEVAATVAIVTVTGLFLETLYQQRYANLGVRPEGVLTLRTALAEAKYPDHATRSAFYDEVIARVGRLPGVVSAAYTTSVPLEWKGGAVPIVIAGRPQARGVTYEALHRQVSADCFRALGMTLRRGRLLATSDSQQSLPVAVINETMARQYWPGEDALGHRFRQGRPAMDSPWVTVVGVVGDVRQMGLDAPVKAEAYFPYQQVDGYPWFAPRDLVVRTSGNPTDWAAAVTAEVHSVDPDQPVSNVRSLDTILDENSSRPRLTAALLGVFAALALLLAAVGIYGLLASFVADRVPEIGLRFALGAEARDIARLIIGKGLLLTVTGAALGVLIATMVARLLTSQLYGVSDRDPTVSFVAAAVVLAVAAAASYLPARRAARMDPAVALRAE